MAKKDDIKKLVDSGKYKLEDIEEMHHAKLRAMAKDLEADVDNKEEEESVIPTRTSIKKKTSFESDRMIPFISVTNGNVFYQARNSGYSFDLSEMGDYDEIPYRELVQLNNRHPKYLKQPLIVLLDEEIVDHFKLDYTNVFQDTDEVEAYLELSPERIEKTFDKLSKGSKKLLVSYVVEKINKDEAVDFRKVRVLEKITGLDLTE